MDYGSIYTANFFANADGIGEWEQKKLKYGDALCTIGYALGLVSIDEVRAAVPFEGTGIKVPSDGLNAREQLARLVPVQRRTPHGVLEIGAGRGEVSTALAYLGYPVQAIEPSPGAATWFARTAQQLFGADITALPVTLLNGPAHEVASAVQWENVDTVVMVESLEHILAEDFAPIYTAVRDNLRARGGLFIITNWLDYHPIQVGWYASPEVHCRVIDDALFDAWSAEASSVVFRQGSHLVLEYAT